MSDSEDDWVDSDYTTIQQNIDDTRDSFVNSVAPSNGPDYAHSNYDALPEKIKLVNFWVLSINIALSINIPHPFLVSADCCDCRIDCRWLSLALALVHEVLAG